MKRSSFILRGFATIGVCALLILGFQNCAQPLPQMDIASASTVPGPVVQVYLSADTTVPMATWTKVPFATAEIDTDSVLNASSKRIEPAKAGYYRVHLNLNITMTGTGGFTLYAAIYKNGQINKQIAHLINFTSGFNQSLSVDTLVFLNGAGDYLEGFAYTNSGTATVLSGATSSWMSAEFVRGQ